MQTSLLRDRSIATRIIVPPIARHKRSIDRSCQTHFICLPPVKAYELLYVNSMWGLKTVDTIGNCQRPVFSLCVSKYMHKITNL